MILLVDKPAGMTSQQVVSKIKRAMGRKPKIGHTGTLDPMCTGLLPVLIDGDTKLTQFLPHRKAYLATVRFGIKTDTGDVTGNVLSSSPVPSEEQFRNILPSLKGICEQVPPMYSAVHVDGQRLYDLARKGIVVDRPARKVEIYDISFGERHSECEYTFSVSCSSGTYIRTLCEDIGERLGVCATMAALRRTQSNGFLLQNAYSLDSLLAFAQEGTLDAVSVSTESAVAFLPSVIVPKNGERYYCNGGILTADRLDPVPSQEGICRAYSSSGSFLGLLSLDAEGNAKAVFSSGNI